MTKKQTALLILSLLVPGGIGLIIGYKLYERWTKNV